MRCKKEFICVCGKDKNCIDTFNNIYGSIGINEKDFSKEQINDFKAICKEFNKLIIGSCL